MELLTTIYQSGGLDELIIFGALGLAAFLLYVFGRRQNAASDLLSGTAQLAKESSTHLQVTHVDYQDCLKKLGAAHALLATKEGELNSKTEHNAELETELKDAKEVVAALKRVNTSIRYQVEYLQKRLTEFDTEALNTLSSEVDSQPPTPNPEE